jgi:hypothetical protein
MGMGSFLFLHLQHVLIIVDIEVCYSARAVVARRQFEEIISGGEEEAVGGGGEGVLYSECEEGDYSNKNIYH